KARMTAEGPDRPSAPEHASGPRPFRDGVRSPRNPWEEPSEVEEVLQADGETGDVADTADPQEHARRERRPVHRVVPNRQGLTPAAEQDLLVGDEPGQPYRVHPHPVHVG